MPPRKLTKRTARRTKAETVKSISLPTEPLVPPNDLTAYTVMVYGEKGIGKTSLCAQFPDMTVTMWEPRRRNLRIKQIPQEGEQRLNWKRFKSYVPLLVEQNTPVSIDTVDRAYAACLQDHCKEQGVASPFGLDDWGALWHDIKVDFEKTMNELLYSDTFVVFVSHGRYREVKTLTSEPDFEMVIPTAPNAAWEYIRAVADLVIYYGFVGERRSMTVRGDSMVWAACGLEDRFQAPDGDSIVTIDAGRSAKTAYKNLMDAFDNKLLDTLILGKEEARIEEAEEANNTTTKPTKRKATSTKRKK